MALNGGKGYLAKCIVGLMPPRARRANDPHPDDPGWLHYVEPYFGGGAVLLANDPEGVSEAVNDINGDLVNFWRVLQHKEQFPEFLRLAAMTPFGAPDWARASDGRKTCTDLVGRAWAFFVHCRQSLAGRFESPAPLSRNRTRGGMSEQVAAWLGAVEGLPAVHRRLIRVAILGPHPALYIIRQQDGRRTLFYLDPPYLDVTRSAPDVYEHEMSRADHANLLVTLGGVAAAEAIACKVGLEWLGLEVWPEWWPAERPVEGRFLVSGYPSELYAVVADACGWRFRDFIEPNHSAGGGKKQKKTERVWANFDLAGVG